jgi:hypothetical protein
LGRPHVRPSTGQEWPPEPATEQGNQRRHQESPNQQSVQQQADPDGEANLLDAEHRAADQREHRDSEDDARSDVRLPRGPLNCYLIKFSINRSQEFEGLQENSGFAAAL